VKTIRVRLHRNVAVAIAVLALASACAGNSQVTPQTRIAQYGASVMQAVREGQEAVIALNKTNPSVMTDDRTRKTLDGIMKVTAVAEKLRDGLQTYDTATNLDFKKVQAQELYTLAEQVAALAEEAFKVNIPAEFSKQIGQLALNIIKITQTIQLELDKVRT
jgi:hypothetical protein